MDANTSRTTEAGADPASEKPDPSQTQSNSKQAPDRPEDEARNDNTSGTPRADTPLAGGQAQTSNQAHIPPNATATSNRQTAPGQLLGGHQATSTTNEDLFHTIAGTGEYQTLNDRVRKAAKWHQYQYWFVAVTSNSLLFIQVLIAASLTVLGAFNDRRARTATIFLGATNTVIAGLLTYFKSRNQPNRSRQLRNDLVRVVDQLDDYEANFRSANYTGDVVTSIDDIRRAYRQARADAEANYPDLWVKAGNVRDPFAPPEGENTSGGSRTSQAHSRPGSTILGAGGLNIGHGAPASNNVPGQQNTRHPQT